VDHSRRTGLILGFSAYTLWGFFPLYWPLLKPAVPTEILAHRMIWSLVVCTLLLAFNRRIREAITMLRDPAMFGRLAIAAIFLSTNWLIFIYAINSGFVVESALGYYINPLVLITFGVLLLRERLRTTQWVAVGLGVVAVLVLTVDVGRPPWIALSLAISWGLYGLIKKRLGVGALQSLAVETLIVSIPAIAYLGFLETRHEAEFGTDLRLTLMLMGAGVVTTIPLLLFNGAATRLPLSMLGLLQYLNPTIQFLLGVLLFHEAMSPARWGGFVIIWIALIIIAADGVRAVRRVDAVTEPA
jgi:chloramphenicol-sensitive protein RarD